MRRSQISARRALVGPGAGVRNHARTDVQPSCQGLIGCITMRVASGDAHRVGGPGRHLGRHRTGGAALHGDRRRLADRRHLHRPARCLSGPDTNAVRPTAQRGSLNTRAGCRERPARGPFEGRQAGGEGGIRTLGRGFPRHAISSRARSTAPAPLPRISTDLRSAGGRPKATTPPRLPLLGSPRCSSSPPAPPSPKTSA